MNNARIVWTDHLGQEQSIGLEHLKAVLVDKGPEVAQPAEPCDAGPWGPCPTPSACKCPPVNR